MASKAECAAQEDMGYVDWKTCSPRNSVTLLHNAIFATVRTHRASVHQAVKLVAALLRVARVTAGLAQSSGSLPPGL